MNVHVEGREWNRPRVGGCYVTARVWVDGEYLGRFGPVNGSGMVMQLARAALVKAGIWPDKPSEPVWRMTEETGDTVTRSDSVVAKEKHL